MEIVKISWSGGKDSTAATLLHLWAEHECKIVNYIPYFMPGIPLIRKAHYDFIMCTAEKFKIWGAELFMVQGISYYDWFYHRALKGKYKGKIFGFPCFLANRCGFSRDSKVKSLSSLDVGPFDYQDIGIAYDELKRQKQLNENKRSILVESKMTEKDALILCAINGFLSPIYVNGWRDGCALCPHASESERNEWLEEYPQVIPILKQMQEDYKKEKPGMYPLRGYKWFL